MVAFKQIADLLLAGVGMEESEYRLQSWRDPMLWLLDDERVANAFRPEPELASAWRRVGSPIRAKLTKTPNGLIVADEVWHGPFTTNGLMLAQGHLVLATWARSSRVTLFPGDTFTCEGLHISFHT